MRETRSFKRVLVVGLGVSGQSACELLRLQGIEVIATDIQSSDRIKGVARHLEDIGCLVRLGEHRIEDFLGVDQIIVSPGVPLDIPPLKEARAAGIEIVGELEWAWRQIDLPVVAITGTNGKTTTTSMIGDMLRAAGKRVFVGGNIGVPLSRWLLSNRVGALSSAPEFLVLEVSSFQLDAALRFAPRVSVILNIGEDHLDRYQSFGDYIAAKARILSNQSSGDVAILNLDDEYCRGMLRVARCRVLTFSRNYPKSTAYINNHTITLNLPGPPTCSLDLRTCCLKGAHNEENLAAAVLALSALGIEPKVIKKVITCVRPLPHRMEWVGCHLGIDFFNDSKATNADAVIRALDCFDRRPIILLAGGRDKGGSYTMLKNKIREKVKVIVAFGEAGPRLVERLGSETTSYLVSNLEEAFQRAVTLARKGDVVLLSPACSSFDQYSNYAERGEHFKQLFSEFIRQC